MFEVRRAFAEEKRAETGLRSPPSSLYLALGGWGKSLEGVPGVEGVNPKASQSWPPEDELPALKFSEELLDRGLASCNRGSVCLMSVMYFFSSGKKVTD